MIKWHFCACIIANLGYIYIYAQMKNYYCLTLQILMKEREKWVGDRWRERGKIEKKREEREREKERKRGGGREKRERERERERERGGRKRERQRERGRERERRAGRKNKERFHQRMFSTHSVPRVLVARPLGNKDPVDRLLFDKSLIENSSQKGRL